MIASSRWRIRSRPRMASAPAACSARRNRARTCRPRYASSAHACACATTQTAHRRGRERLEGHCAREGGHPLLHVPTRGAQPWGVDTEIRVGMMTRPRQSAGVHAGWGPPRDCGWRPGCGRCACARASARAPIAARSEAQSRRDASSGAGASRGPQRACTAPLFENVSWEQRQQHRSAGAASGNGQLWQHRQAAAPAGTGPRAVAGQ
jgi:hypothetical protein